MFVSERGRSRGVGHRLMRAVEERATGSGARLLHLAVIPGNNRAVALYRSHGFVETDRPGSPLPEGRRQVAMAKRLGGTPSRSSSASL